MSKKKIIGVTGPSVFSNEVRGMVEKFFGAIPLDLNQNGEADIKQVFNICDAIILAGGRDIYPNTLDAENGEKRELVRNCGYSKFDKKRDLRELELIKLCEASGKPLLGICRGFQLMLSVKGLYLYPDISGEEVIHSPCDIEVDGEDIHYIRCLDEVKKEFFDKEMSNSFHHQGIAYVEPYEALERGVEILATANLSYATPKRQEVLIIEAARGKNWLGVQFHPEDNYETNRASQIFLNYFKNMIGRK
jgi:putative glutamine amidotransferase